MKRTHTLCRLLAVTGLALAGWSAAAQPVAPGEAKPDRQPSQGPDGGEELRAGPSRGERGRDGERRGRGSGRSPELTDAQIEEAVALMEQLDPEMAQHLARLREERPELLGRVIAKRFPRLGHMLRLKAADPAMYDLRVRDIQLEQRTARLARRLVDPQSEPGLDLGADAAEEELRAALVEHFSVRQSIRRAELEDLRERLVLMQARLDDDEARRDALIGERYDELLAAPPQPGEPGGGGADGTRGREHGPDRDRDRGPGSGDRGGPPRGESGAGAPTQPGVGVDAC